MNSEVNYEQFLQDFKKCRFHAVIFDSNKYKNHMDAILNNDYQYFYPDTSYVDISDLNQLYNTTNNTVNAINNLSGSNFKAAIPFFYFNLLEYDYYDYLEDSSFNYNEISETSVIDFFIEYILNKTNSSLIINGKKISKEEFLELYDNDMNETFELIYQDLLGNVTIDGKSIKSYYEAVVVNDECIDNFIRRSKFEDF